MAELDVLSAPFEYGSRMVKRCRECSTVENVVIVDAPDWGAHRDLHRSVARPHDGHALEYVMVGATIFLEDVTITPEGNVTIGPGSWQVHKPGEAAYIWCDTCQCLVNAGEDGLAEDWEQT